MKTLTFTVYLESQPGGGFTATVPAIPEEVVPRHPEIDAALAEALEDVCAGRVTPAFNNMKEYEAWCLSDEGKRFLA